MYPRAVAFRIGLSLSICASLVGPPSLTVIISGHGQAGGRTARPRPGKPEGLLPNLDRVQNESQLEREWPPPIPSTIRSPRNAGQPWDGRRVGEPNRTERAGSSLASVTARRHTRHAHARAPVTPPPVPDTQFVQNFFTYALARNPLSDETTYWHDQLRVAYAQGSLRLAGLELGRTLFESTEYAARGRNANQYVWDLYKTYLMREPDAGAGLTGKI